MDSIRMGEFICSTRKSKNMTQKKLAEKLHITDKAVSKWERGLSCPDISLLTELSSVLGVTTSELLNGEKNSSLSDENQNICNKALEYADKSNNERLSMRSNIAAVAFSALLLVGLLVCTICDIAITRKLTWSLYPISSIVFAWLVFFPVVKFGKKGLIPTLIILSCLILPFLYTLDYTIPVTDMIFPIGLRMSLIGIPFIWCVYIVFRNFYHRIFLATGLTCLIAIPVQFFANYVLSFTINEPFVDAWDIMSDAIILLVAVVLLTLDFCFKKLHMK